MMPAAPILVTGATGFIGYHVAQRLLREGCTVVGLDNLNEHCNPAVKETRLAELVLFPSFRFTRLDLADRDGMAALFARNRFRYVVHLWAQAGGRHSLVDRHACVQSNLFGFASILEGCRHNGCRHLLYASSSSVFGANARLPFSVYGNVEHPLNLYGTTKKCNELLAHSYSHLFGLPITGLRFFTGYGPWSRPDMAMWLFADAIIARRPIKLFNNGRMRRDFTYVDDVVESVIRLIDHAPRTDPNWTGHKPDPASSAAAWRVHNIRNHSAVELLEVVRLLEEAIGIKAECEFLPMEPGDALERCADVDDLAREVDFRPATSIAAGIRRFVEWFQYYSTLTLRPAARVGNARLLVNE